MTPKDDAWLAAWSSLMSTAAAFRRSCLLFAAVDLGVFAALSDRKALLSEVARAIELDHDSARILLDALVAMGVLQMDAGGYAIDPALRPALGEGEGSMLHDLRRAAHENEVWLHMAAILRGKERAPADYRRELLDGRILDYPGLMQFNRICASAVLGLIAREVMRARSILDLGGGDGVFARAMLQLNLDARLTVLELEGGAEGCLALQRAGVGGDRLSVQYGDARRLEASGYDLVLVNELLELFAAEDKERIVRGAVAAAAPSGVIAVVKFTLDAASTAPASAAVFSMRMRLKSDSWLETDAEVVDLLQRAGCGSVEIRPLGSLKSVIVARRQ